MSYKLEPDEKEILEDFEKGKFKRPKNETALIKNAKEAAANYFKKDARINIRLSGTDLYLIKRKASEEGLPYQTLIASILHKFASGRLAN